ncbi:hypothetical protein FVE85_6764 [Porphyridium purpureum]|uniref:ACT domain-containing protein n=1 Tax=Porphyridium purpureum TaxID=35688 RepID=A0A5J4Z577_PORPP|nr:hypothetical protein FVE85_6764 [Porphyridium purpureum]|eukprot:POR9432..scf295_1
MASIMARLGGSSVLRRLGVPAAAAAAAAAGGAPRAWNAPRASASLAELRRAFMAGPEASSTHVLFMSGPDRAGVVSKLAATVSEMGGNMEASRSTLLGDQFSLIALMSIPESSMPSLSSALQERMKEYVVYTRPAGRVKAADAKKMTAGMTQYELQLEGPDSVGIISAVTESMARCSVSILDMQTDLTTAPFAGFPMFVLTARFGANKDSLAKLQNMLQSVEDDFGLTITVNEVDK